MVKSLMVFEQSVTLSLKWLTAIAILFVITNPVVAATSSGTLTATVDRTRISEYETLELTLRTDKNTDKSPGLSSLEKDFEVVTTRQNRQIRIINGQTESWLDWIVTLSPKREGRLTIPAIKLGSLSSEPINILVQKNTNMAGGNTSPVFMRTEVDNEFVYVQQQVILTLQVFYRVNLYDDSRLSPLAIDGAIVQQLGDTQKYDTVIDGKRYGVFELKFAIHPQKAGKIEIPELTFNGTMAERNDPFGSMFSMSSGKAVVARSAEIILNVQPQPDDYTGRHWLPANGLTLTESWSQNLDEVHVGDAITRTITIEADGLTSAQLPAVQTPRLQDANVYPDQSKTGDTPTATSIIGNHIDAIAIIPTASGGLRLPPVRYSWFDIESNQEKVAEVQGRTIKVLPSTTAVISALPAMSTPTGPTPKVQTVERSIEQAKAECPTLPEPITLSGTGKTHYLWQTLTVAFVFLWLITLLLLLKSRSQRIPVITDTIADEDALHTEPTSFKLVIEGCRQENANEVKLAFIKWSQLLFNDFNLYTIDQCLDMFDSKTLNKLFQQMDAALYSPTKSSAPFIDISKQCEQLRKKHKQKNTTKSSLPELYPSRK